MAPSGSGPAPPPPLGMLPGQLADPDGQRPEAEQPDISKQRSSSHGLPDSPKGGVPQPEIKRQRSNSIGHAATSTDFHPDPRAQLGHPHSAGARPVTPRSAMPEMLDWEETTPQVQQERTGQECIRVAARFRPLSANEMQEGGLANIAASYGPDGRTCTIKIDRAHGQNEFNFAYDNIFQPDSTQEDVYATVAEPIVEGVINGFNGAILAYGQTGSGKTHTMLGPAGASVFASSDGEIDMSDMGLIPRALQGLLDYAGPTEGAVQLRASYVEIYNEHCIDLLSPARGGSWVQPERAMNSASMQEQQQVLYLPTVTETPIGSVQEALQVMRTGNINRHQAETKMNRHSSRSHAVFIVTVTNSIDKSRQKFAQLYLVDLAGSERVGKTGVAGQQLEEAKNINRSLLALGQVIWALAHKQKHVPYRDSKLTQLLRNCLGGNARTAIMIAVSPHMDNANESLSALRFGARASLVENAARENIAEDPRELKRLLLKAREDLNELRIHCRRLQAEVAAFNAAGLVRAPSGLRSPGGCGQGASRGAGSEESPLHSVTAKRLLVWGLLPSLVCPLNRAIMRDPVCASDGWTYERVAIEKHFLRAGRSMPLSPVSGQRLTTRNLVPNNVVKQLVRQHLPDLAQPEVQLPLIQLLHVWHVQMILSYLDGRSLARCESAWTSFLAAAESSRAWSKLLVVDFGAGGGGAADDGAQPVSERARYAGLKLEQMKAAGDASKRMIGGGPATKGLRLLRG